jgi:hypothetical protein
MSRRRRETIVLSVLALAAVALGWWRLVGDRPADPARVALARTAAPPAPSGGGAGRERSGDATEGVPVVELDALKQPRPAPLESTRDPFRFKVARPPLPQLGRGGLPGVGPRPAPPPVAVDPSTPPPPPPPPPITLKFIGIVQVQDRGLKLAVLSDSRGVYFGGEGEIIEGRYRITRIGTESIVLTYLDGTGQRVIPLSGS